MPQDDTSIPTDDLVFLREEIRHEDNLLNQHVWLVSSQSFLLTGFAIALNGPPQVRFVRYEHLAVALVSWIPIVGVLISLIGQITILAGAAAHAADQAPVRYVSPGPFARGCREHP